MGSDVDAPTNATIIRLSPRRCPPLLLVTLLDGHHALQGEVNRSDFDAQAASVLVITTGSDTFDARHAGRQLRHIHEKLPQHRPRDREGAAVLEVHAAPPPACAWAAACVSARRTKTTAISRL